MLKFNSNSKILDINYFAYAQSDAEYFYNNLVLIHPQNHLYITKENMRFYVRGMVVNNNGDMKFERYQIALLAYYSDCLKDIVGSQNSVNKSS